ncbi:hypothetical protein EN780_03265 [Mesorhizobium sp. M4B.F.Ca.ET.089.01.1.1]|uniref:hypothetical protein n=1 Tax=Mesorhizobium sp. M4B.F.Ca.ET.089.01.1.1 TaxID=2496662 RepID=UPI000FE31E85|nr:hypothetical protein [Mesorhizobium sp. M4B.F.Ca.ET.089.01.1.1]RWX70427.1 hypothetical protein EN780_03265 [Mesorhizobium sp. M4B.F.Ca.ET.089.01.1.1]
MAAYAVRLAARVMHQWRLDKPACPATWQPWQAAGQIEWIEAGNRNPFNALRCIIIASLRCIAFALDDEKANDFNALVAPGPSPRGRWTAGDAERDSRGI